MRQPSIWDRVKAPRSADEVGKNVLVLLLERFFKTKERETTIYREIYCGFLHFISAGFILSVNAALLSENAHYEPNKVAAATALSTGLSCIICGTLSNLPFVLAPTTSTSLYFSLYLQNHNMTIEEGNFAVFLLAILFTLCGWRPIALFISNLIPFVMKVGVCLGVGLLIALEALYEIGLVTTGEHTVLDIGAFTPESYISMFAFVVIGLALHYKIRGAFLIGLVCGTLLVWMSKGKDSPWPPKHFTINPGDINAKSSDMSWRSANRNVIYRLVFDLYVVGVILLNGLAHGLAETAGLKRVDNTLPRGKWLYASCGLGTLLSAFIGSGPIMISPESAPGIKAGARSGLSSVVCGICFLLSTLLCPLFAAVPSAGTSPVLLMIGMFMFENAGKVDWSNIREALPVFVMAIFVPFTYSIFNGVTFGFSVYAILLVVTDSKAVLKRCRKKLASSSRALSRFGRRWCARLRTCAHLTSRCRCCRCFGCNGCCMGAGAGGGGSHARGRGGSATDDLDNEMGGLTTDHLIDRRGSFDLDAGDLSSPSEVGPHGYVSLTAAELAVAPEPYRPRQSSSSSRRRSRGRSQGSAGDEGVPGSPFSSLSLSPLEGEGMHAHTPGSFVIEELDDSTDAKRLQHDDDDGGEDDDDDSDDGEEQHKRLTFALSEIGEMASPDRAGERSPQRGTTAPSSPRREPSGSFSTWFNTDSPGEADTHQVGVKGGGGKSPTGLGQRDVPHTAGGAGGAGEAGENNLHVWKAVIHLDDDDN